MKKDVEWICSFGNNENKIKRNTCETWCRTQNLTGLIEEDNTIVFQTIVSIKYDTKEGQKILKKAMENLDSPVKLKLQSFDRNNRKDREENRLYYKYIPDEIIKKIFPEQEKKED